MPRPSTISVLPDEIVDAIQECFNAKMTLDDIVERIKEMGAKVSRSALGRHKLKFDDMMDKVRHSRIMAETLVENLGDASESKIARANIELMHSALLKISLESEDGLDPKEVYALSKALEALAKAKKIDQDTIIEAGKVMQKKAAQAVDKAAVSMGMTAETREKFNRIIFGIEA
ncbi:MAG: hypothetical protein COB24_11910 [Hyphomicrobiales bacterium]|nr:MAG: hypothetical protein COB24_11910 [Hyphomicrobiales bacterium]